jgi:ATP phosphoribosyltransferase
MITLALSKGRIYDETLPLLQRAGVRVTEDADATRKLILATDHPQVRVIIVRASDVPTYVQYGGADFGVAGKDMLLEHGGDDLYQPLDLKIAQCRMSVATRADFDYAATVKQGARLRVATKYVKTARHAIVDLVSTGSTLKANNLIEVEHIMPISSRLIVNQAALKLKREMLKPIIEAFEKAVMSK